MGKNIVIFSDGTGNSSGIYLDENRSNIYKLFRATRCGPDSEIKPSEQLAFYDPGVGTLPPDDGVFLRIYYRFMTMIGAATGLGITKNVVECYAALIRMYEPGDRIFLFGFSRGAYTVRLLGGVLSYCGIPYRTSDGQRVKRDYGSSQELARHAVTKIYQHMESMDRDAKGHKEPTKRQLEFLDQRDLLGDRFREKYSANGSDGKPEAKPHFIGVFDTVSSLFNFIFLIGLVAGLALFSYIAAPFISALVHWMIDFSIPDMGLPGGLVTFYDLTISEWFFSGIITLAAWLYFRSHLKFPGRIVENPETGRGYPWWRTVRLSDWRMRFDDYNLSPNVVAARHALSIDERRYAFDRVPWSDGAKIKGIPKPEGWFQQVWFAGVHSDIGGSYADNEARLSDISLKWMVDAATKEGLVVDPGMLKLFPNARGRQHDEFSRTLLRFMGPMHRTIASDAPLHPSVIERFEAGPVLNYDVTEEYRPSALRKHKAVEHYFGGTKIDGGQFFPPSTESKKRNSDA